MSYILDALRKNEQGGQHTHPTVSPVALPLRQKRHRPTRRPLTFWLALTIVIANVTGLIYYLTSEPEQRQITPITHIPETAGIAAPAPETAAVATVSPAIPTQTISAGETVTEAPRPAEPKDEPPVEFMDLPETIRSQIPRLHLDVHVYSEETQKRYVMIELQKYHEQERINADLVLEQVLPDGVVFRFQERRFFYRSQR